MNLRSLICSSGCDGTTNPKMKGNNEDLQLSAPIAQFLYVQAIKIKTCYSQLPHSTEENLYLQELCLKNIRLVIVVQNTHNVVIKPLI